MSKNLRKAFGFEGVTPGQTATVKLPIGTTLKEVFIKFSGVTLAQMTAIRVKANNKIIFDRNGTDLDLINQFEGFAAITDVIRIPFYRRGFKTRLMEDLTILPTQNMMAPNVIRQLVIEIDIAADAVAPFFTVTTDSVPNVPKSNLSNQPLPLYNAGAILYRNSVNEQANVGRNEFVDLPRGDSSNSVLNRIFFKVAAGSLDSIEIRRDNSTIYEADSDIAALVQSDGFAGRVPQHSNGLYCIDPGAMGNGTEFMALSGNDLRIAYNVTNAGTVKIYPEYIGELGQ